MPLRAYWTETVKDDEGDGRPTPHQGKKIHHVVELRDDLEEWIEEADKNEAIRMISGEPGSGKSSAAKMFAASMSRRSNLHVVWVPLHHFDFDRKLAAALEKFCMAPGTPPEDFLESSERVLLIFDGLDELALTDKASQETAKAFVGELLRLVEFQNRNGLQLQALLSGREVAIQEYAAELRRSRTLFLLGYLPDPEKAEEFEPTNLYRQDRRDTWWSKHHDATGQGPAELPKKLRDDRLRDLTSQPLLTVLLALVDHEELDLTTPWALNALYESLLGHVYDRKWGDAHPQHRVLSKTKYLRVLEEIAVGAWHSGEARQISRKQIVRRCEKAKLQDELQKFAEAAIDGVTQLLTAFYFRKSEGFTDDGEMTFEFTHKSFAECLVARRIAAVIAACHEDSKAHEADADRGKSTRDLLATWAKLLGPEIMEDNLADLVRGEILKRDEESLPGLHAILESMLREAVHRGYPMEQLSLSTFPEMKRQARHAELALAVCTAAAAEGADKVTALQWKDADHPADWLHWLSFGRPDAALLTRKGLQRSVWSEANLVRANLQDVSFDEETSFRNTEAHHATPHPN